MTHPAIERELSLLSPATRSDEGALEDILHRDFVEIGSSGRVWTRLQMITALVEEPACPQDVHDIVATELVDGLALITYKLQEVWRSSIWVRDSGRWQIRYHQGTPLIAMSENR